MYKSLSLVVVLVLFVVLMAGCAQVPAGHVGVYTRWKEAKSITPPGLNWYGPGSGIKSVNCQVQQYTVAEAQASSKDLQVVHTSVSINYHIDPSKVLEFWNEIGYQRFHYQNGAVGYIYQTNIIEPRAQEVVKSVSARFTANELVQKREQVKDQIEEALIKRLAQYYLKVEAGGVNITNFTFSKEYDAAIERKVVAQQDLQRAEIELQTARVDANTQRVKAQSYTTWDPKMLFLEKWDGKLPTVMGGNTMMNIPGAPKN